MALLIKCITVLEKAKSSEKDTGLGIMPLGFYIQLCLLCDIGQASSHPLFSKP